MDTNASGAGGGPDEDAAASWTNETLSMPVRRQLLDRDLRMVIDGKRQRAGDAQAGADDGPAIHPRAGGDAEHGS